MLFHAVRLYCSERETDGVFSRAQLLALAEEAEVPDPIKHAATWVKRGLWEQTSDGWHDTGFLTINASHAAREKERQRLRDYRRVQRSRTAYAYTTTGEDRTGKQDVVTGNKGSSVVLVTKQPRPQPPASSPKTLERVHQDTDAEIDAVLAEAEREKARQRRDLLARARLHDLARKPVRGLKAQVQR